jgi:hypothetical protein
MQLMNGPTTTCQFTKSNGEKCKRGTAHGELMCWQHAQTWRRRLRSLTKNQTVIFVMGFFGLLLTGISVVEGIPPLIDWWQPHHRPAIPQPGSPPIVMTDPKNPHSHTVTLSMPKNGWMAGWGSAPPNLFWATVNGIDAGPAKSHLYLLITCRVADPTIDEKQDTRIEKSVPFELPETPTQFACAASQSFLGRLIPPKPVFISLVIMPNDVQPNEIHTLADVEKLKGSILITNSVAADGMVVKHFRPGGLELRRDKF